MGLSAQAAEDRGQDVGVAQCCYGPAHARARAQSSKEDERARLSSVAYGPSPSLFLSSSLSLSLSLFLFLSLSLTQDLMRAQDLGSLAHTQETCGQD